MDNEKTGKKKLSSIFTTFVLVLLAGLLLYFSQIHWVKSFSPVTLDTFFANGQKDDFINDVTYLCNGKVYEVTHTMCGIPISTERFFICATEENSTVYIVRAGKNFYKNNFDNATGVSTEPVKLKGLVRNPSYELRQVIADYNKYFIENDMGITISTKYIDLLSQEAAIGTLIGFILIGIPIVLFTISNKKDDANKLKKYGPVAVVLLMIGLVILLHYVDFISF